MRSHVQAHQSFDPVERRGSEHTGALRALSEDGVKRLRLGRQVRVPLPNGLERRHNAASSPVAQPVSDIVAFSESSQ